MGIRQREISVAGALCRLMSAGLVGVSLGVLPAGAAPNDIPVTTNAGMGTGDTGPSDAATGRSAVPLTTPLPPAAAPLRAPPLRCAAASMRRATVRLRPSPRRPLRRPRARPLRAAARPDRNPFSGCGAGCGVEPARPGQRRDRRASRRAGEPDAREEDQEALAAFYGARQTMPVFVTDKGLDARGKAVIARMEAAGEDGLDPDDYQVPALRKGASPADLARTELKIALAVLTYARHAQSGRFDPSRISSLVTPVREIPEPTAVLAKIGYATDANAALAAFNPPHAGYRALKAQLARTNGQAPAVPAVPAGPR